MLAENIGTAKHILAAMNNNIFKLYFTFLSYILDIVNKINVQFQAEGFRMHILVSSITSMYKTVLKNFMRPDYVDQCSLDKILLHPANYLQLNEIYVGAKSEIILLEKSVSDNEIKNFKVSCLHFYVELCKEIIKRFKFYDPVLNFAQNLDPEVITVSPSSITPMYVKFNSVCKDLDIEQLSTEWRSIATNDMLLKNVDKPIEEFWTMVFNMKNSRKFNASQFNNLCSGLFCFTSLFCSSRENIFSTNANKNKK